MKVSISTQGDIALLQIEGRLEIEKIRNLKSQLQNQFQNKKVIFCLDKLSFVGSCGIQQFFNDLDELQTHRVFDARVVGLRQDFQFMLRAQRFQSLQFVDELQHALTQFQLAGGPSVIS